MSEVDYTKMTFYFETPFLDEIILVALISILIGIYQYTTSTFDHWKKRGIPFIKPFPFLGNLKDVVLLKSSRHDAIKDFYRKLEGEPFGGIFLFRSPVLIVRDPDIIKSILVKDFSHFQNRVHSSPSEDPVSDSLAVINGPKWRILRTKLTPTFTSGKLKNMMDAIFPKIAKLLGLSFIPKDAVSFFSRVVKETVQYQMTDDMITGNCFVFFMAGFDTSATTMSFALYELAVNPDIQERLSAEIDEVLQKHKGKITYDAIHEMRYLDKVVN
ncbi:unnamed protein product, partial [Timema podura]|nr:unnamed protein product [Timema podura]